MSTVFDTKKILTSLASVDKKGDLVRMHGTQCSLAVTAKWSDLTGTKDAVFSIQVANVPNPNEATDADWETKASYTLTGGDATAQVKTLTVDLLHEAFFRAKWVKNSIAGGQIDVYATAKRRVG